MNIKVFILPVLLAGATLFAAPARAGDHPSDILVIVNKKSPATQFSGSEIRRIFLSKKKYFSNGARIIPINAREGSLRALWRGAVLGMSRNEEFRYWQGVTARLEGQKPAELSNALRAVYKLRNAVAYVFRHQYRSGVAKIVAVIPKSR